MKTTVSCMSSTNGVAVVLIWIQWIDLDPRLWRSGSATGETHVSEPHLPSEYFVGFTQSLDSYGTLVPQALCAGGCWILTII